ncbi:MAG: lactate utilization protein [Spirochaetales bacterium]|nr:lactate utilization protein [Spirochaetales bacterium]
MDINKEYYRNRGERVVRAMHKRNFFAEYFDSSAEAVKSILKMIPEGASVSWGGSVSLTESGLKTALQDSGYNLLDREKVDDPGKMPEFYYKASGVDYYIMSANAITIDGKLVNIDGRGNRLAALLYGPKNIIVIAGMNKVVESEEEAVSRVKNVASPLNAMRLEMNTPCTKTGSCADCQSTDCICANTVITRRTREKERIKVFLIGEKLGF